MDSNAVSEAILEMRDLLRLLAEPAVAERDRRYRDELKKLVGTSKTKGQVVLLMDGTRTQTDIHNQTQFHKGNLSTLVKQLSEAKLLSEDLKQPKLVITIPNNFFEI